MQHHTETGVTNIREHERELEAFANSLHKAGIEAASVHYEGQKATVCDGDGGTLVELTLEQDGTLDAVFYEPGNYAEELRQILEEELGSIPYKARVAPGL
jgi:hypothetical protein